MKQLAVGRNNRKKLGYNGQKFEARLEKYDTFPTVFAKYRVERQSKESCPISNCPTSTSPPQCIRFLSLLIDGTVVMIDWCEKFDFVLNLSLCLCLRPWKFDPIRHNPILAIAYHHKGKFLRLFKTLARLPQTVFEILSTSLWTGLTRSQCSFWPGQLEPIMILNPSVPDAPNWRLSAFEKRLRET